MSKLLRYKSKGNLYFITNVTHNRNSILVENSKLITNSIDKYKAILNIKIIASVILPDHFHLIIDPIDTDISNVMQKIKLSFSRKYQIKNDIKGQVWQKRFWDHIIRDQVDLNNHIDYIHYNSVKHKYVKKPLDWDFSSFNSYYQKGFYTNDWGVHEKIIADGDFGE